MYNDIGKKIQGWAKAIFVVEAIAAIITGFVVLSESDELVGFLILFCGPVAAWVSSWLLYGFGEIIVKLTDIETNTRYLRLKQQAEDEQRAKELELARQEERRRQSEKKAAELREQEENAARIANELLDNASTNKANGLERADLYQRLSYALQYQNDDHMIKYLERIDDDTIKSILQTPKNSIRAVVKSTRDILKAELNSKA